jgi:prevent-host-death family protein
LTGLFDKADRLKVSMRTTVDRNATFARSLVRHREDVEMQDTVWSVAEAKSKLSRVIELAHSDGPQLITKNGRPTAVVVDVEEWQRKTARKGTLS